MILKQRVAQITGRATIVASAFVMLLTMAIGGCGRSYPTASPPSYDAEGIKQLVSIVAGKPKPLGMGIKDNRIPAANNLAQIGPAAKEYGAVAALEKMAADKANPNATAAAQAALEKVKGM